MWNENTYSCLTAYSDWEQCVITLRLCRSLINPPLLSIPIQNVTMKLDCCLWWTHLAKHYEFDRRSTGLTSNRAQLLAINGKRSDSSRTPTDWPTFRTDPIPVKRFTTLHHLFLGISRSPSVVVCNYVRSQPINTSQHSSSSWQASLELMTLSLQTKPHLRDDFRPSS